MIYTLLLWVVLLAPLPFGSVFGWSWAAICLLIGLLSIAWGVAAMLGRYPVAAVPRRLLWVVIPFTAALGNPLAGSISLNPVRGQESLLRLTSYGAVFWLALQAARDRDRAYRVLYTVAVAIAGYGLYGLVVQLSGSNTILWFDKTAYLDQLTGPFVNHNSFATFAGLGLVCATGLLWHDVRYAVRGISNRRERQRLLLGYLLSRHGAALLGAWFVLTVALLLSESRAGSFATACAILTFITSMLIRGGRPRWGTLAGVGMLALVVVMIFNLSGAGLDQRLARSDVDWQTRQGYNQSTLRAIQDAPWLGTGLGSFESVFRFYASPGGHLRLDKAHNDYLEMALELGLPAAGALLLSLLAASVLCALGAHRRRRDASLSAIGLAASVLVGVHSGFDFSLQIPAVALVYALILGAATAQSWSTRR